MRRLLLAIVLIVLAGTLDAAAQGRFILRRTKKESIPIRVQLYGGYNGISEPSNPLQDAFDGTAYTSWGGVMIGMQGLAVIDTLGLPIWAGIDLYYHRTAKRFLYQIPTVFYRSDSSRVHYDERLFAVGGQLILGVSFLSRFQIQVGGGAQYLFGVSDVQSEVVGRFAPVWVPTFMVGLNAQLLSYEHGSIDANFRGSKGFGDYGSVEFQSLLGFTFDF